MVFIWDHTHNSSWLPVHIRDMTLLHHAHLTIAVNPGTAFLRSVYHACEENNFSVKGERRAVGLT